MQPCSIRSDHPDRQWSVATSRTAVRDHRLTLLVSRRDRTFPNRAGEARPDGGARRAADHPLGMRQGISPMPGSRAIPPV